MTNPFNGLCVVIVSVISLSSPVVAQNFPALNQNVSKTNNIRGVVFSVLNSKGTTMSDSVARSTSFMPSAAINYYTGSWGIGLEVGGFNASPHFNIEEYIKNINDFSELNVNSTQWKNLFIVAGPSFRKHIGAGAYLGVDLYAGLMKTKSPSFSITDKESGTSIVDYNYLRKTTTANENPLFTIKPGIKLQWFPGNGSIGLDIHGSYINTFGAAEITNYYRDLSKVNFNRLSQQEIREQVINAPTIETKSKGAVSNISFGAGISIALSNDVVNPRDPASGLPTGKRQHNRDAGSGLAVGKRQHRDPASGLPTGKRQHNRDAGSGLPTGKRQHRDPASGLATGKRSAKQTQGSTFGEKVNAGFHVIIGSISSGSTGGIVNNKTVNPLYDAQGKEAQNPMHEGIPVVLVDESTGAAVSNTLTEKNGDFYFANVPSGNYLLKLSSAGNDPSSSGIDLVSIDILNDPEITSDPTQARRRVEVLKSNKTGDPITQKNKVEHWGDPHENLNGKHIRSWLTSTTTTIYLSLD